eukprot:scaffold3383_cov412-Prasinococcus_capsulatus_cf.AAC.6
MDLARVKAYIICEGDARPVPAGHPPPREPFPFRGAVLYRNSGISIVRCSKGVVRATASCAHPHHRHAAAATHTAASTSSSAPPPPSQCRACGAVRDGARAAGVGEQVGGGSSMGRGGGAPRAAAPGEDMERSERRPRPSPCAAPAERPMARCT